MSPNPVLGIPLHWLGGFASGSFYVPFRGVKAWAWETYWLVGGLFSWLICPSLAALLLTESPFSVIAAQSAGTLWWTYFFGLLWGLGGLTYGLTMRYLGLSLGTGVALGFCAAFGTLLPPAAKLVLPAIPVTETIVEIAGSAAGRLTLAGIALCFVGIAAAALAGLRKERAMPAERARAAVSEFNFGKGMAVATFCGVMSACFAFALTAGNPIGSASLAAGTPQIWTGLPKLVVVLWGGFTTNVIWCLYLNRSNRTGHQYLAAAEAPLARNYLLSAAAGTTWYLQFFFYTMGETQMGRYGFASWTVHMASIILFATGWGWVLREWKGAGRPAHNSIAAGIALLILSTLVIGAGAYLNAPAAANR